MLDVPVYTVRRNGWTITTARDRLDRALIHAYLTRAYWSPGIPRHVVEKALDHSLCFGLFERTGQGTDPQIGFARVVTDLASFAYLADVFVLPHARGSGAGTWMIERVVDCPLLDGIRSFLLATRDAHDLYARVGFKRVEDGSRLMVAQYDMPWRREELAETFPGEAAALLQRKTSETESIHG